MSNRELSNRELSNRELSNVNSSTVTKDRDNAGLTQPDEYRAVFEWFSR